MNDFVMSVVNEVLNKSETCNPNNNQELIRPNYQRQNENKRLLVYDLPLVKQEPSLKGGPQAIHSGSLSPTSKLIQEMNNSKSDSLQALRMQNMAAVTTNVTNTQTTPMKQTPNSYMQKDNSKDFTVCSIENHTQLKRLFGFPYSSKDTVCIGMQEQCFLSQLFAVNEILNCIPALDFSVQWSLNRGENFVFQAIGTKEQMEVAADILNAKCINTKGVLMVKQPSAYLKKRLNSSADTIGTIEGVPYARLLPSVAEYCKEHADSMVEYQIVGSYLLVNGQIEEVEQVLKYLL